MSLQSDLNAAGVAQDVQRRLFDLRDAYALALREQAQLSYGAIAAHLGMRRPQEAERLLFRARGRRRRR